MAKIVTFGELLLRLNTPQSQRFTQIKHLETTFAGAEANVAVACAQFGHQAVFVSALPGNAVAEASLQQLASWRVDTSAVLRCGRRVGVYYLEGGYGVRPSSVIYDREGSSFAETPLESYAWDEVLGGAQWLHLTGITPALSPQLRRELPGLARKARSGGVKVSFDVNYRSKLWEVAAARPALEEMAGNCDLLLASVHQIGPVLGVPAGSKGVEDSLGAAGEIRKRYGVPRVVLTSRETLSNGKEKRWAVGVSEKGADVSAALEYEILDPLGGGDAFSGGLLSSLMDGGELKRALDFAVAAAAWKYSHHGDYLQGSREEVEGLLSDGDPPGVRR